MEAVRDPPAAPARLDDRRTRSPGWQQVDGGAALLAGTANVIMQLSHAPVGHGVVESDVDSGNVMLHPAKRLRTTLTYVAIALAGTDEERRRYRNAVDRAHTSVHSRPDSPVEYNAFDPELQRWVAACLHVGAYCHYLLDVRMLSAPVSVLFRAFHRFVTTGLLPGVLREQLGLAWTARDERRHRRLFHAMGAISRRLPGTLRRFPLNTYLWDVRRRMQAGTPLV